MRENRKSHFYADSIMVDAKNRAFFQETMYAFLLYIIQREVVMKKQAVNFVIFFLCTFVSLHAQQNQTSWLRDTVSGLSADNEKLDTTEGLGAYFDFCLQPNTKNFDNGGGSSNLNTQFLKTYTGVVNVVYDPFKRSKQENDQALLEASKHDFDTATSNSVLNVIDNKLTRLSHIFLSCDALKEHGKAYFKVYSGNNSSKDAWIEGGFQSNRDALSYQSEVEEVFGKGNVASDIEKKYIVAYKNQGCHKIAKTI